MIPASVTPKQEDYEFQAGLVYTVRSSLKTRKRRNRQGTAVGPPQLPVTCRTVICLRLHTGKKSSTYHYLDKTQTLKFTYLRYTRLSAKKPV